MATGTIKNLTAADVGLDKVENVAPNNATVLFSNVSGTNISGGGSITLSQSSASFKLLYIMFYTNSIAGGNRGTLLIPVASMNSATYWPIACGGNLGTVRMEGSGTTLTFLAASYSTIFVTTVIGIK